MGLFWQRIPAYREVTRSTFLDHNWQAKNTITNVAKLLEAHRRASSLVGVRRGRRGGLQEGADERAGQPVPALAHRLGEPVRGPAPHPVRSRSASRLLPDHPKLHLDSLHEQDDAPVPGLTHRYPDKALFLPLDTCPVYCRFCTRSYAVGVDTEEVEKVHLKASEERWRRAFEYIASRPELEDIVISGGDAYQLRASANRPRSARRSSRCRTCAACASRRRARR